MADDTSGFSEGGAAAWKRDSKEAKSKTKLDLDTSVTPERTSFPAGNLTGIPRSASSSPSDGAKGLSNPLTNPSTKSKGEGGKLLQNKLTRGRGRK